MTRARRRSSSEIEMSKSDVLHVLQHGTVVAIEPLKREPATRRRPTRRKQRNLIVIESIAGGTVHVIGRVRLVDGEIKLEGVPPQTQGGVQRWDCRQGFQRAGRRVPERWPGVSRRVAI